MGLPHPNATDGPQYDDTDEQADDAEGSSGTMRQQRQAEGTQSADGKPRPRSRSPRSPPRSSRQQGKSTTNEDGKDRRDAKPKTPAGLRGQPQMIPRALNFDDSSQDQHGKPRRVSWGDTAIKWIEPREPPPPPSPTAESSDSDSDDEDEQEGQPELAQTTVEVPPSVRVTKHLFRGTTPAGELEQRTRLITGTNNTLLSFIAIQLGRSATGPFYEDCPEYRELRRSLEQQQLDGPTKKGEMRVESESSSSPTDISSPDSDLLSESEGSPETAVFSIGARRLEVVGKLERVTMDGRIVWRRATTMR